MSGAANASAVVEPIADFPKSSKGVAGALLSSMLGPNQEPELSDDNTTREVTRITKNQT